MESRSSAGREQDTAGRVAYIKPVGVAFLSGWEVSSDEMKLTRKPPILFRFARHGRPLGKQRGERSQRQIVPSRPKNAY